MRRDRPGSPFQRALAACHHRSGAAHPAALTPYGHATMRNGSLEALGARAPPVLAVYASGGYWARGLPSMEAPDPLRGARSCRMVWAGIGGQDQVAATMAGSVAVVHARPRTPGRISGRLRRTRVPARADPGASTRSGADSAPSDGRGES